MFYMKGWISIPPSNTENVTLIVKKILLNKNYTCRFQMNSKKNINIDIFVSYSIKNTIILHTKNYTHICCQHIIIFNSVYLLYVSNISVVEFKFLLQLLKFGRLIARCFLTFFNSLFFWSVIRYSFSRKECKFSFIVVDYWWFQYFVLWLFDCVNI